MPLVGLIKAMVVAMSVILEVKSSKTEGLIKLTSSDLSQQEISSKCALIIDSGWILGCRAGSIAS
jgi:hypothetical protein